MNTDTKFEESELCKPNKLVNQTKLRCTYCGTKLIGSYVDDGRYNNKGIFVKGKRARKIGGLLYCPYKCDVVFTNSNNTTDK